MDQATQIVESGPLWFISLGLLFLFGVVILIRRSPKSVVQEVALGQFPKQIQTPEQDTPASYIRTLLQSHGVCEVTPETRIPDHLVEEVLICVTFKYSDGRSMMASTPCTVGDILRQLE